MLHFAFHIIPMSVIFGIVMWLVGICAFWDGP